MKSIRKLTDVLGKWLSTDSAKSEAPLLLQSLEDRVLYSAVPLPVDNVDAPVENTDFEDIQFVELESNTTLPIGEAIAEETSARFLEQAGDEHAGDSLHHAIPSAEATLADLEQLADSIEQNDSTSSQQDGPRTAMGLATATPSSQGFYTLEEGQSFTIDNEFLSNLTANSTTDLSRGFTLVQQPASGVILVNGEPVQPSVQVVTSNEINNDQVVFVPDPSFVGEDDFTLQGTIGNPEVNISLLYEGVADDGVAVFGDTFAPVDGAAPTFEATVNESEAHVQPLSDGGYVVVSSLGASDGQVEFQIFDNGGSSITNQISVANELRVENIDVTAIDDGGFLVAYASTFADGDERLNVHRFDGNGQELNFSGSSLQLPTDEIEEFTDLSIEYLGEDRFVISYIQSNTTEVQTAVYNLDGAVEKTFDGALLQSGDNIAVRAETLSDGGYVLARVKDDAGSNRIYASIFDAGGHLQEDVEIASGVTSNDVAIVGTVDNGFAVVWQGTSGFSNDIFAAKFDRSGNLIASEIVGQTSDAISAAPDIVTLDDGSFVVAITTLDSSGTQEIFGQRLNADLSTLGDAFKISSFSGEDQTDAQLAVLKDGTLVASFESGDQANPVSHFHQRFQMSISGDEDTWIALNSVVGIDPASTTEVFETLEITGLPVGSKVHAGQLDLEGELIVHEIFSADQVLIFNPTDIGQLEFLAPADVSGTFDGTAILTTNDGAMSDEFVTEFQIVVNAVDDAPISTLTMLTTDEDTSLTVTQAEFIGNFLDVEGELPTDLLNPIGNVNFVETDFEQRIRNTPSPTSGISSSYIFDGTTALTANLPSIGPSASFELWIRSEDFAGSDRVIAQFGDENRGFSLIQRQDEVVLQFKSDSSEIIELTADGLNGIERFGSYDQIVVSFGTDAGDTSKLDAALYLNGQLSESITDVSSAQYADVVQVANTLNLGSSGGTAGVGTASAENFGGELGLLRFENGMLDADAVRQRYNQVSNAPRIVSINGQSLTSDTIYFASNENSLPSTLSVLPSGDLQFDPQSDFNSLTQTDIETVTNYVVIQRGAETFDAVTELNVVGRNDLPVQQHDEITINRNGGTQLIDLNDVVVDPDNTLNDPANPPADIFLTTPVNGANIVRDADGFHIELVPSQLESLSNPVLNISVIAPNSGEVSTHDLTINLVDEFTISGVVAHDRNIDGSLDDDSGFEGVNVLLYESSGGSLDLANATFVAETRTTNLGRFTFDAPILDFDREYFVVVDSLTVALEADDLGLVWAQQTFATEGAVFTGSNGLELTQDEGYLIGGKDSEISDMLFRSDRAQDAQHIIAVSSSGNLSPLNELGFGFNFDIVNVVDNSDQAIGVGPEIDGQGTLNQFIHNANNIDGGNRMFFVPSTDTKAPNANGDQWWQIGIERALPTIHDDFTIIDGFAFQTSSNGLIGTNIGFNQIPGGLNGEMVGVSGDWIGESDAYLNTTTAPALEITRLLVDDDGNAVPELKHGIRVRANADNLDVEGVAIRNIAINGFGITGNESTGNIVVSGINTLTDQHNVSGFSLTNNVIGADPYFTAVSENHNPASNVVIISAAGSEVVTDGVLGASQYSNVIENNIIGYANYDGILLQNGGEADLDASSHWTIRSNQISFNGQAGSGSGILLGSDTNTISVQENYINGNQGYGIDSLGNDGRNEIFRNTIENNRPEISGVVAEGGGIRLFGSDSTVYANSISNNGGPGVHVVGTIIYEGFTQVAFHNLVLSNEFFDNDGISIDLSQPLNEGGVSTLESDYNADEILIGDGVNDFNFRLVSDAGNTGIDAPVISSATYDGSKISITFSQLLTGFNPEDRLQIYIAENGVTHGEGNVFLGEVLVSDLVVTGGAFEAELDVPSDRLPFDLTQEININATMTAFATVTVNEGNSAIPVDGYQTSEFSSSQTLDVNLLPEFEAQFISTSVTEGETTAATIPANGLDLNTVSFSIANIGDGTKFSIDDNGLLTFLSPPDFEFPEDIDGDNNYEVLVRATEESGATRDFRITVTVLFQNEAPVIPSGQILAVTEGTVNIGSVAASDVNNDDLTFTLNASVGDSGLFDITSDGVLTFRETPDFESPSDADSNNSYQVRVVATDARGLATEQDITVDVGDVNELPVFTNPIAFEIAEGNTMVGQVTVNDPENNAIVFSIIQGVGDGDLFSIDTSGNVSFIVAPDFENPMSVSGGNEYTLTVVANDGSNELVENHIFVNVTNQNAPPVIVAESDVLVDEGNTHVQTISATDADGDSVTLSIVDDGEPPVFMIDELGNISFINVPDFEAPFDAGGNNVDLVTVLADDGEGATATQTIRVTLNDVDESPVFVGDNQQLLLQQNENSIETFGLASLFVDPEGQSVTLEIVGGENSNLFHVVNNELTLIDTPVLAGLESPIYEVEVLAHDGVNDSETKTVNLQINNINDRPEIVDITPVVDALNDLQLSQVQPDEIVADLNQAITFDRDGDPINFQLDSRGKDNQLFYVDPNNQLRIASVPRLEAFDQKELEIGIVASDGQLNSAPAVLSITIGSDSGVNVVDVELNPDIGSDPQIPDIAVDTANNPEGDDLMVSVNPDVVSTAKPRSNDDATVQSLTQRRNDINGITAISDLKIVDDDVFLDITFDSVSYDYQLSAHGPQLASQEIGGKAEYRHAFEAMELEESMLAKYFWQGFEDSEDEFIRRNLQVDNTAIVAASAGLSLGLVSYLRLAAMATTVATQLPAWKTLDIAPLIREFDAGEAETIHQIVDK